MHDRKPRQTDPSWEAPWQRFPRFKESDELIIEGDEDDAEAACHQRKREKRIGDDDTLGPSCRSASASFRNLEGDTEIAADKQLSRVKVCCETCICTHPKEPEGPLIHSSSQYEAAQDDETGDAYSTRLKLGERACRQGRVRESINKEPERLGRISFMGEVWYDTALAIALGKRKSCAAWLRKQGPILGIIIHGQHLCLCQGVNMAQKTGSAGAVSVTKETRRIESKCEQ